MKNIKIKFKFITFFLLFFLKISIAKSQFPPPPNEIFDKSIPKKERLLTIYDKQNFLYGVKNEDNDIIIPPVFVNKPILSPTYFYNSDFKIIYGKDKEDKTQVFNIYGKFLFKDSNDSTFKENFNKHFVIQVKDKCCVFDYYGQQKIKCEYDRISNITSDSTCIAIKNKKYGLVNLITNKINIPFIYYHVSKCSNDTFYAYMIDSTTIGKIDSNTSKPFVGVINQNNEIIIDFKYDDMGFFNNQNLISLVKNGKHGILNLKGEEILPFEFVFIGNIQNGFAKFCDSDKNWGFIDEKGEILKTEKFKQVYDFNWEKLATCKLSNDKWVLINANGEIVKNL